ncbi:MAG: LLM class flavin-dependent oxidoreductase [Tepidiformaceae bacterium]
MALEFIGMIGVRPDGAPGASVHVIGGGIDPPYLANFARAHEEAGFDRVLVGYNEYLEVMHRTWTSEKPFDFEGEFYRYKGAYSDVKPLQQPCIPVYFGGQSEAALGVSATWWDTFALWGEPLAAVREKMAEVRAAAAEVGRSPAFSVSLRPILAVTEAKAWERARAILASVQGAKRPAPILGSGGPRPEAVGSQRLLRFAAEAEVHDKRLWTPIAAATGATGNTTALVGTPEQVAESMLDYYDLGVRTLLIRGFDPLPDAIDYGRELIPLVRAEVAKREAAVAIAT